MTYTLAQIRGYTAAAAYDEHERERARLAHTASAIRTAMWADKDEWQAYQAELSGKAPVPQKQGTTTHG
ncbi:TPA: hypothetical protein UOA81_001949 [Stenotrophomonas maltophilia]|nr:hypothetical protein [Stenotrophomonas maltophilia]